MHKRETSRSVQSPVRRRRPNRSPVCFADEEDQRAATCEPDVRIKRIYDSRSRADGFRVLVDRIWPRGVTKEAAALDAWARNLAPTAGLRKWFGHDPNRWVEFQRRYCTELRDREADLIALRARACRRRVTLLYAAREPRTSHAAVLRNAVFDAR